MKKGDGLRNCASFQDGRKGVINSHDLDAISLFYTPEFMDLMQSELDTFYNNTFAVSGISQDLVDSFGYYAGHVFNLFRITLAQTYGRTEEPKFDLPTITDYNNTPVSVFTIKHNYPILFSTGRSDRVAWNYINLVRTEKEFLFPRLINGKFKEQGIENFLSAVKKQKLYDVIKFGALAILLYYTIKSSKHKFDKKVYEFVAPIRVARNVRAANQAYLKDSSQLINLVAKIHVAIAVMKKITTNYIITTHSKDLNVNPEYVKRFYAGIDFEKMYSDVVMMQNLPDIECCESYLMIYQDEIAQLLTNPAANDIITFFKHFEIFQKLKSSLKNLNTQMDIQSIAKPYQDELLNLYHLCEKAYEATTKIEVDNDIKFILDDCKNYLTTKLTLIYGEEIPLN